MMNKADVVKAAIAHRDSGKVPHCINFTGDALKKYGEQLYAHFVGDELEKAVRDGILIEREALSIAMGNHVFCTGAPWWRWHDVPESYKTDFRDPGFLPKTIGTGSYERFVEKLRYVREHTECYILILIYGSHFEKANAARGIENFLADMAGNVNFAKNMLDTIIRKNMVMLENIVSIPDIDGILLGSDWGSQQSVLMSPKTWRTLIAPGELREYQLIKAAGHDVWIHSCGNITKIIPDLIEMGVDVLNPVQPECMNIYDLKDKYGNRLTFWGGISTQQTLPYGTPKAVRAETQHVITYMGKGGGYITAPAQEIQNDVPLENIYALIEEAQSFA